MKDSQKDVEEVRSSRFFEIGIHLTLSQDDDEDEGESDDELADGFSSSDEDEEEGYSFVSHTSFLYNFE